MRRFRSSTSDECSLTARSSGQKRLISVIHDESTESGATTRWGPGTPRSNLRCARKAMVCSKELHYGCYGRSKLDSVLPSCDHLHTVTCTCYGAYGCRPAASCPAPSHRRGWRCSRWRASRPACESAGVTRCRRWVGRPSSSGRPLATRRRAIHRWVGGWEVSHRWRQPWPPWPCRGP